jgi:homoserine acetyltransferase
METDYKKLLRISQVLNNTFGSDGPGHQHINGMNVRLDPIDSGLIRARCIMTVTYRSDQMMRELQRKHRDEALAMIRGAMERVATDYQDSFDEKLSLEMDDKTFEESTEFIHVSQYSALSRAFYRVNALIRVK